MSTATQMPWMMTPETYLQPWQDFYAKFFAMPKVIEVMRRTRVGATPTRPVYREDGLRLLEYETDAPRKYKTPLLLVFALVNRPYILDLKTGKSVIAHFLGAGFDCYNVDWGTPTPGDRHLALEDYVLGYMDHCVDVVRRRCDVDRVNLIGYCMGGTMSAMYTALRPEKVRNLVLMAAPVDWSTKDSLLALWSDEKYFDIDRMMDVYGNAPAEWLQVSFQLLRPVANLVEKWVNLYENLDNEKFLEDFFAMETWLNDNIPVAGEIFRQFVKYCFQRNLLIQGKLTIGEERVDLRNVRCPVLNLVAQHDHLVLPGQSTPFNDVISSTDRKVVSFPVGHIGLAVSSKSHRDLWPSVVQWLGERSEPLKD